jgi:carbamate kinase
MIVINSLHYKRVHSSSLSIHIAWWWRRSGVVVAAGGGGVVVVA